MAIIDPNKLKRGQPLRWTPKEGTNDGEAFVDVFYYDATVGGQAIVFYENRDVQLAEFEDLEEITQTQVTDIATIETHKGLVTLDVECGAYTPQVIRNLANALLIKAAIAEEET